MKKHVLILLLSLTAYNGLLWSQQKKEKNIEHSRKEAEEEHEEQELANEKNEYAHAHSSWYTEMIKRKPNLERAQQAFSEYFNTHSEDSRLKDRFVSWIQQASLYKDKRGYAMSFPVSKRDKQLPAILSAPPPGSNIFGSWKMIGPANLAKAQCNNNANLTGGFCDRVYVNPYNTQNLFAGYSYGGLWVSTDQGASWQLTDGNFANGSNTYANRDYYYGEIEAHKLNSSLVFAATEAGLLKSTTSGTNWSILPQLNRISSPNERPYFIALATDDQNVVLSTFGRKLYRSTDGGNSWSVVFDNSAGGSNHYFTSQYNKGTTFGLNDRTFNFFGLEANFNNSNEFYLGVWNAQNQACIYKSTDRGTTFNLLVNLNTTLNTSWTQNSTLCMKAIPSSPDKFMVYEQFVNNKPCYKFSSSGTLLSSVPINAYAEAFDIDWNNENTMYEGQYGVYNATSGFSKSSDGGNSFTSPFNNSCNFIHADIRGVSAVGNVVLIGNDGGLALSTDGAQTVTGTGFEVNSMDIWGFASSPRSDICVAGLDHNHVFVRTSSADGWQMLGGADSGPCSVNPVDDHWIYYNWGYGVSKGYLSANNTVRESSVAKNVDLGTLQFHPYLLKNIFGILSKSSQDTIFQSSDNMTTNSFFTAFSQKITALRIARRDPRTMYVLLNQTNIKKTTDSGATWIDITPSSSVSNGQTNITSIETGKTPGELWAAYGNAQNSVKVLYTTNGGGSWVNITTNNLPAAAVSDIAYQRGTNGGVYICIITSNGTTIWYKNNNMNQWQQVGNTLPLMGYIKNRLFVVPAMNKIRFGGSRGAWETDLYETSGVEAALAIDKPLPVCNGDSVQYYNASATAPGAAVFQWKFPGGTPASSTLENPKVSYATPGVYGATMIVTTAAGTDTVTVNNLVTMGPSQCTIDTIAGNAIAFSTTAPVASPVLLSGYNALAGTNAFTISAWIKPAAVQTTWAGLFCANNESSNTTINFRNSNFELGVHWKGNLWSTATNLFVNPDEWNHIAMVAYPDSIRIYLNGQSFTYIQTNAAANWKDILLGGFNNRNDRNYAGLMDEIRIYNRSLSQDEIRALRHLTIVDVNAENGLTGYLQFNNTSNFVIDKKLGATVASLFFNNVNYNPSTAPVASGVSEKAVIGAAGMYHYLAPQTDLSFAAGSAIPNGDVWVSRLNTLPFNADTTVAYPQNRYYIINNYGQNVSFTAPNLLSLKNVTLPYPTFVNSNRLYLVKRGDNKDQLSDWSANLDSVQLASNNTNTIDVPFTHLPITGFGQFVLIARSNFSISLAGSLQQGGTTLLNWQAIRDGNGKNYDLQRSTDRVNFSTLTTVATVNTTDTSRYSFTDQHPVLGTNYYRIKRTAMDGSVTYSNTISVNLQVTAVTPVNIPVNDIAIAPVPVARGTVLNVATGISGKISYRILGLNGQTMASGSFYTNTNLNIDRLSPGTYLIQFTAQKQNITKRILVE